MAKRKPDQLRPTTIEPFPTNAAGSVMITMGNTRVLCTASIAPDTPRWIKKDENGNPVHGWVSAEYAMLPGSTPDRKRRGPDGRSTEIQRLIGRVLRAAVDMDKMPGLSITVDCDVVSADGGTRTAAITGGYVALAKAIKHARSTGMINMNPIIGPVTAISVGIIGGTAYLDLDYPLDVAAEVDMNVAMDAKGNYIEVQGTGEKGTFSRDELDTLLGLADKGIKKLRALQKKAV
jgi:ribonuclease PH